ncbi:MAG: 2Fe-2S iron-sulfur cluster-binding protein, partial [Bacteroidota bacterium]
MAKIIVANLKIKAIHCKDKTEKLLDILLSATDWMHACGGKGRCVTCKARILHGEEFLSQRTAVET